MICVTLNILYKIMLFQHPASILILPVYLSTHLKFITIITNEYHEGKFGQQFLYSATRTTD